MAAGVSVAFVATTLSVAAPSAAQAQIDRFLSQSNDEIQHRLGIYNEESARRIAEINAQLASIGADVQVPATAIGGTALALLAVGALANNCVTSSIVFTHRHHNGGVA